MLRGQQRGNALPAGQPAEEHGVAFRQIDVTGGVRMEQVRIGAVGHHIDRRRHTLVADPVGKLRRYRDQAVGPLELLAPHPFNDAGQGPRPGIGNGDVFIRAVDFVHDGRSAQPRPKRRRKGQEVGSNVDRLSFLEGPHHPPLQAEIFHHPPRQAGPFPVTGIGRYEQIDGPAPALQPAHDLVDMGIGGLPLAGGFQGEIEKMLARGHAVPPSLAR